MATDGGGVDAEDDLAEDSSEDPAGDVEDDTAEDAAEDVPEDAAEDPADDVIPDDTGDVEPGDTELDGDDGDTDMGDTIDASDDASDASDVDEDPPVGTCPAELPDAESACPRDGLVCQYGDDLRRACRPAATCTERGWSVPELDPDVCGELPDVTCPATVMDARGQLCEPMDAFCGYEGLICHCTNCMMFGPVDGCFGDPRWQCDYPNMQEGCPEVRPNHGEACNEDGLHCDFHCGPDGVEACRDGVWVSEEGGPCPISTREAKRDIEYLDDEAVQAVADEALGLRLATWEYIDPAMGEGQRLGIIIEDSPGSPAVDEERRMIDLYGYASMLLATVQAQQAQLDAMAAELEALRARVEGELMMCGGDE
ncbi:MAG: hypothetical protein KDA28_12770 [Phycisphaerales bacterium]|nr:hypothetical protein [Phycisphaerales bacterium]